MANLETPTVVQLRTNWSRLYYYRGGGYQISGGDQVKGNRSLDSSPTRITLDRLYDILSPVAGEKEPTISTLADTLLENGLKPFITRQGDSYLSSPHGILSAQLNNLALRTPRNFRDSDPRFADELLKRLSPETDYSFPGSGMPELRSAIATNFELVRSLLSTPGSLIFERRREKYCPCIVNRSVFTKTLDRDYDMLTSGLMRVLKQEGHKGLIGLSTVLYGSGIEISVWRNNSFRVYKDASFILPEQELSIC